MDRKTTKQILISIFVGAAVAFFTTLLQGLLHWLQTADLNLTGVAASVLYFIKGQSK